MEFRREEILPGVFLTALRTDKFKTAVLSLSLLAQLDAETASMNALIPSVLRRGTVRCPDMDSLAAYMDGLYGLRAEPVVRCIGEIQAPGFVASFPEDRFLPRGERLLERAAGLLGELLLSPNTRGGLFLPEYVERERARLAERIRAKRNNKDSYAVLRLVEEMCAYEPVAVGSLGSESGAEGVGYVALSKHYRQLISTSPIELFYCGASGWDEIRSAFSEALAQLPRGEICWDMGTDIRMNSVEEKPRVFRESADLSQGKLALGWRIGEWMENPDQAALTVFNSVFGGSASSKLFANVREKLSLCYYASSGTDIYKGLLLVASAVNFENFGPDPRPAGGHAPRRDNARGAGELAAGLLGPAASRGGRPSRARRLLASRERLRLGAEPGGAGRLLRTRHGRGTRRDRTQLRAGRRILSLRKGGRRGCCSSGLITPPSARRAIPALSPTACASPSYPGRAF